MLARIYTERPNGENWNKVLEIVSSEFDGFTVYKDVIGYYKSRPEK